MDLKLDADRPCPCGSGKKYADCHLNSDEEPHAEAKSTKAKSRPSPEFIERAMKWGRSVIAAEKEREERFGNVPPIVQTEWEGKRVVAIGMKLYSIDPSDSFWTFLRDHLHDSFSAEWWQEEMTKHPAGRHPFAQWEAHAQELMRDKVPDERGRYFLARDGLISAYLTLAYDLYVVKHNIRFKEQVLERLRHRDQFTGVRYELLVAATFVRAGFQVEPEDETDPSKKHPEFVATHRKSKFVLAVEAKARNRRPSDKTPEKTGVEDLIEDAARKAPAGLPFALFVEVAMPPEDGSGPPSWLSELEQIVKDVSNRHVAKHGGRGPFDWVFCTSIPHQFGEPKQPNPPRQYLNFVPHDSRIPSEIRATIAKAILQYGNIPKFEDRPDELLFHRLRRSETRASRSGGDTAEGDRATFYESCAGLGPCARGFPSVECDAPLARFTAAAYAPPQFRRHGRFAAGRF